ncbi:RluA family pseudouridine synthase [Alicyclobacillus sp. SO9]|uniref:RluA family pseudouridine synthase n=1 Tax=Alicyclobacillus sp. SO9 TaxID=2665646 RepID=UPI0018E79B80|nr:RluA family pseudouridine synthase [Alicyclobacillus sp. SO9]QQE80723.1 RluA family pseudouridine synthase [Alicyclobacillus sp. SO9]
MNEKWAIVESFTAEAQDEGIRLDKWLTDVLQERDYDVSRNQVQDWLKQGFIQRREYTRRLRSSDLIEPGYEFSVAVPAAQSAEITGESIPLDVVYEDAEVIVINKPRGMVVHPGAGHTTGTMVNALVGRGTQLSNLGGEMRPGVVHRIDKDTSGLLVFAKTDRAYHGLSEQLREHSMTRQYEAICHGLVTHDNGTIDAPVGRDAKNRQRMAVTELGKEAVTHFRVEQRFTRHTFLSLRLETGRTHQIRVHLAYIGHPLAGDPIYGPRHTLPIAGQALHAHTLGFVHPVTKEELVFEAAVPQDMTVLLEGLRQGMW